MCNILLLLYNIIVFYLKTNGMLRGQAVRTRKLARSPESLSKEHCPQNLTTRPDPSSGLFCSFVWFQTFAKTHDIVNFEPDCFVEFDHFSLRTSYLKVDFWATYRPKVGFCFIHHSPGNPCALMLWMDSKIVDPTTMTVVSDHDGGNDMVSGAADNEKIRLHLEFSLYVTMRIVPWNDEAAVSPQLDYGFLIRWHKWSDFQFHNILAES